MDLPDLGGDPSQGDARCLRVAFMTDVPPPRPSPHTCPHLEWVQSMVIQALLELCLLLQVSDGAIQQMLELSSCGPLLGAAVAEVLQGGCIALELQINHLRWAMLSDA